MMVSIVVPVAREGYDLYERIYALHRDLDTLARELGISFEIILASDLLHKPTIIAMARLAKTGIARCLLLTRRIGKGGSIKNAVFYARGDYIVLLDADIPVPAEAVCRAVLLASRARLDLLAGNRVYRPHSYLRRVLSIAYNSLVNLLFRTGVRDHQAGFKVLSRRAARVILVGLTRTDDFAYDTEVIVWAKRFGLRYRSIDVVWRERRAGSTIAPVRVLLTMLADLLVLRMLILARKYTAVQKQVAGRVIELGCFRTIGWELVTMIRVSGLKRYIFDVLRDLYIAVAFRGR